MNTKLTLTIEDAVIKKAKKYAADQERSLSDIIENYLKAITSREKTAESEYPPIVKSLKGSFKAPKNPDYKKDLAKILSDKYL